MTDFTPGEYATRLLPWLVAVAFFMQALDTTILNTAVADRLITRLVMSSVPR